MLKFLLSNPEILNALLTVLSTVIVFLLTALASWARSKTKNLRLGFLLDMLSDIVLTCVHEAEQTAVKSLRSSSTTGKLSPADAVNVKNEVLARVKMVMGEKLRADLQRLLGQGDAEFQALVEAKVEAAVLYLPPLAAPALPASPVAVSEPPKG